MIEEHGSTAIWRAGPISARRSGAAAVGAVLLPENSMEYR